MECASCGRNTTEGDQYKFYYGKRGKTDMIDFRTSQTRYAISDSEDVFLCDQCVDWRIERRARLTAGGAFLLVLLLATLRLVLGGSAPQGSELESVIGFPMAFVFGLLIYFGIRRWKKGKQREYVGDALAITTRKSALIQRGFDAFFTRDDYLRLY